MSSHTLPPLWDVHVNGPTPKEVQSIETAERPPIELSERKKPSKHAHSHPLSIHTVALLVPFSILGLLTRLGLEALGNYNGRSIFPLAYSQGLGCLVMGLALGLKEPFSFYPPLYTAITTGFCGSLTTFSGWQLGVFESWINASQLFDKGLHNFMDGLGQSVFTLSISIASVSFGLQLAGLLHPYFPVLSSPGKMIKWTITLLSLLLYGAVFPAFFLMSPDFRYQATAALLYAFPGALTRHIISVKLNTALKAIPLGTFLVNSCGTALLGGFSILQRKSSPVSSYTCSTLQGLDDGYCGCLTTVSTFAVEVKSLGIKKGARYAAISWSMGQLLLVVIVGSAIWSGGAKAQITCKFT